MNDFPEQGRIQAPTELADSLLAAAESLPRYENAAYYDKALQRHVHERVRGAAPEAFDRLMDGVRARLRRAPFGAVIHGLRFDEGNRVLVAVNSALGELFARPNDGKRAQLLHYIEVATDKLASGGGYSTESERLHTDCADWPEPAEIISMLCIRSDRAGGGRSLSLSADAIREALLLSAGPEVVRRLETEAVPWRLAEHLGGGVVFRPVLSADGVRWRRYTIDDALTLPGVRLSPGMAEILDLVGQALDRAEQATELLLAPGELLFLDNRRCVHSRTPVLDPATDRLMLRSWIRERTSC